MDIKETNRIKAEALNKALFFASGGNQARLTAAKKYFKKNIKLDSSDPKVIRESIRIAANSDEKIMRMAIEHYETLTMETKQKDPDATADKEATAPKAEAPETAAEEEVKEDPEEPAAEAPDVTEAEQYQVAEAKRKRKQKIAGIWAIAIVVLFVIVLAVVHYNVNTNSEKTAITPVTGENIMFLQISGANEKNRVDSDFSEKYAAATKDAANLSEAQEKLLLKNAANNAARLAIWSYAFGLYDDPNDLAPLLTTDKKFLSDKGQALYYKLEGALDTCVLAEGNAPANGTNSGVNSDGTYVAAEESGVTGDTTAIVATKPNGDKVYIMKRCGNPVTPTGVKPTVPKGPTDEATPPEGLAQKSDDPADYKKPGDDRKTDSGKGTKPIVAKVTTKATPAADVDSSEKLNDNVPITERVTKDPGSETAITAEDATPVTTKRTIPDTEKGVDPGSDNSVNEDAVSNPF